MKRTINLAMLFVLLTFMAGAQNWGVITLNGYVFDEETGLPVPNHDLTAEVMSGGMVMTYYFQTGLSGYYGDSIPVFSEGTFTLSTNDCNGIVQSYNGSFFPGNYSFSHDFYICYDSTYTGCEADYVYELPPAGGTTVFFTDLSTGNPSYFHWDFGDGTTSTEQNPVHSYNSFGPFPVCLTISSNDSSCYDVEFKDVYLGPGGDCQNWFTYETYNNVDFAFIGQSAPFPADIYFWDFGDGATAEGQNVTHTYNPNGVSYYIVTLTTFATDPATGDSCIAYSNQEVWINGTGGDCINWFGYETLNNVEFAFFGESVPPAFYYHWDFGDGSFGTGQTASHSYGPNTGQYVTVVLTTFALDSITGDSCVASSMQDIWLNGSGNGCENWFWYEQNNSYTFNFHGESFPLPANLYSWDFGDGQTGYGQEVTHTFDPNTGDVFLVTLTTLTWDPGTADSCIAYSMQEVWVNGQGNGCENWFWFGNPSPGIVEFHGESFPLPAIEYLWDFGDGSTGTGQVVEHLYDPVNGEMFMVKLTTLSYDPDIGDSCVAVSTQDVWVGGQPGDCQNWFWYESSSAFEYLFHGESFPPAGLYVWTFDNGTVEYGQEITHTFDPAAGDIHIVCLTTYHYAPNTDSCTFTSCQEIFLGGQNGVELFGTIYAGDSIPADYALVGLFGMQPDGSFTYNFTTSEMGMYFFGNVQPGDYYIFASLTPQSQFFYDYFPTYYGDAVTWSGATLITLGETQNPYDIQLVLVEGTVSGSGTINGSITMGEGKGNPGTHITVMLMDENENTLAFTESNDEGLFSFENLAFATYKLMVEIPGKPSAIATVVLQENNPEGEVTFIVKETEVTLTVGKIPGFATFVGEIFPNPVANEANLEISLIKPSNLTLKVLNQLGQEVQSTKLSLTEGDRLIKIETSGLRNGFYTLQITNDDGGVLVKKFIK